jgi:hypothetical protein
MKKNLKPVKQENGDYRAHNNQPTVSERIRGALGSRMAKLALRGALVGAGTVVAGGAGVMGAEHMVQNHHEAEAKQHEKDQAAVKQVVEPALQQLGAKAVKALHEHSKIVQTKAGTHAGEVKITSTFGTSQSDQLKTFSVVMGTNAEGQPDPATTFYASGFRADNQTAVTRETNSGFEIGTPKAAAEGYLTGTDNEAPSTLSGMGYYAESTSNAPEAHGALSTSSPDQSLYVDGEPVGPAATAASIAEDAPGYIDDTIQRQS